MKPIFFATPAEFGKWLARNHDKQTELVVGFYKRDSGKPSLTWPQSVDEALCWGWIDGVRRTIDEEAYTIRFTPRKPTSIWSAINVAKVAALREAGRMRPEGEAAFAKRSDKKTGVYSFERPPAASPPAQETRLRANTKAAAFFAAKPPWYQRAALHWVTSAKREETRERRFAQLLADSAAGRTIAPLTRKPS